jgi:cytochrome c biogenesis protein CcdA
MNRRWHVPSFFNRRLGLALGKGFLLGLALTMFLAGLPHARMEDWRRLLAEHSGWFLAWRMLLYGVIVWGWLQVRRLRQYEPAWEARVRWRRTEIAVVSTFVLLEVSQLWQGA